MAQSSDANQPLNVAEMLPLPPALFAYSTNTIESYYFNMNSGDLHRIVRSCYKLMREEGQLCDVTFLAGANKTRIKAHRLVLAGVSEYFATMFTSQMKEQREPEIPMEHVRDDVLEAIINYCYTRSVVIQKENVQPLYTCAHLMQMYCILRACSRFLIRVLHPNNCVQIKLFAELMSDADLLKSAKTYLAMCFDVVIEQEEILHINLDQLIALLERDNLKIEREEYRFRAVQKWIEHNPSARRIHIQLLLPLVDLTLMDSEFLLNEMVDFLSDDLPIVKIMFFDLLKSRLLVNRNCTALS